MALVLEPDLVEPPESLPTVALADFDALDRTAFPLAGGATEVSATKVRVAFLPFPEVLATLRDEASPAGFLPVELSTAHVRTVPAPRDS